MAASATAAYSPWPNYGRELEKCKDFLSKYTLLDEATGEPEAKYMVQLQKIADRKLDTLVIALDDVVEFEEQNLTFVKNIESNTRRYVTLFSAAVDTIIPRPTVPISIDDDVLDILISQRITAQQKQQEDDAATAPVDPMKLFPPTLLRRYDVIFRPRSTEKPLAVRQVRASSIGGLVSVRGIVTRISEVKPKVLIATYSCEKCGAEIYQEVLSRTFTPLVMCESDSCKRNSSAGRLFLQTRGCKFAKFQEMKIQELATQVPVGHIPRSMTVHVYGSQVRTANPGDIVTVSGIFLPTPHSGFRAIKAGLIADTFLEAMYIEQMKLQFADYVPTEELLEEIADLRRDEQVYNKLASSIAPEIYGHEDVKKALLLLLVGGVTRVMDDGLRIRGDIHICLMGDPGVAKSQLLKYIASLSPRGVYTTGKGSSGVGLTAAVMRDPVTNDMVLEGGALVLADNGVCCIDEFDKMDDGDRTSIHEVMEQQTVSIAKAGITTSLNARAAVLAAANPAYGRYNRRKTPLENINLPAALLSRFDLLFLMLDKPDQQADLRLAQHVTHVHMNSKAPPSEFPPISAEILRGYIAEARRCKPVIPRAGNAQSSRSGRASDLTGQALVDYVVNVYVSMRKKEAEADTTGATTARSLLAILRLAQALARLRFSEEVCQGDVDEALRLMVASKSSLDTSDDNDVFHRPVDKNSAIYDIIKNLAKDNEFTEALYDDVLSRILPQGYKESDLAQCIDVYQNLNVWTLTRDKSRIRFVS